jgi:hypothetical protein
MRFVTGVFQVSSRAIERDWPSKARQLSLRFHVDHDEGKVWGKFDAGICEGFLLLQNSPDALELDTPLRFRWRGSEADTGDGLSGVGEVTFSDEGVKIAGVFKNMYGTVDFKGRRKLMPSNVSGYEPWYYRSGWRENE